jgi:hypothetical protein
MLPQYMRCLPGAGGLPSVTRILERATKESTKSRFIDVFNAGVSALASVGDVEGQSKCCPVLLEAGVTP